MSSGDLVALLAGAGPGAAGNNGRGVSFRQGVIVTWDRDTAENTVLVGNELFTNLPILNTSEAAILAEGDVVGILTMGATWGILGRFAIPGSPEVIGALSTLRTQSADVATAQSRSANTYGDLTTVGPAATITVGPSGKVLVTLGALIDCQTPSFQANPAAGGAMSFAVSGANTIAVNDQYALHMAGTWQSTAGTPTAKLSVSNMASRQSLVTGLTPGSTTFTAKYRSFTSGENCTFQLRNITVVAI